MYTTTHKKKSMYFNEYIDNKCLRKNNLIKKLKYNKQ